MKKDEGKCFDRSLLHCNAEKLLQTEGGGPVQSLTPEESQRLVHELQVHQVELEIQNEELKLTRDELETALSNYTDLYDFAPVGYFTLGRDTTIRAVNLTGADLLGTERSRLIKRRLDLFVSNETRPVFDELIAKVFESGNRETCEVVIRREKNIPLQVLIEAVRSESGEECRTVILDITERKTLEQHLLQARKMESVGLLAGGVAHDFNNMLAVISGYGELIRGNIPADNELLQESIEHVLKAAGRAADLTGRLLAFSRKQLPQPKPVVIDAVIEDIARLIRRVIGADIEFNLVFSCKELLVMADVGQLEMALINLANNARDAMPGGGRLSISTRDVTIEKGNESHYDLPSPGRYALITVADTGTGIARESMERLFEPFYTTKEVGKGSGLGLSIVHGITKQHGGSVQVHSVPGEGATFNIYLPLIEGGTVQPEPKMPEKAAGGTETILVAEDEELVRFFSSKILERAGYRVIAAADGEEAVVRFRENDDISLILSDLVMPGKSGIEMFEEIKTIKPGVKAIFITGYSADIIQEKGMHRTDVDLIMKPFMKNDLLLKIREVLDRE